MIKQRIYHKSWQEGLKDVPDKFYDVAIEDPPYGINASRTNKASNTLLLQPNGTYLRRPQRFVSGKSWDDHTPDFSYWHEIKRVSRNQIVWGGNYMPWLVDNPFKPPSRNEFEAFLKNHHTGWIIWDKLNGDTDQHDCELAYTSFKFPSYVFKFLWNGMMQGLSCYNGHVQRGNKSTNEKRIHPTQKPTSLYHHLMINHCNEDGIMLDSHGGSASSALAAFDLNREIDVFEIDEEYYRNGIKRYQEHTQQLRLF